MRRSKAAAQESALILTSQGSQASEFRYTSVFTFLFPSHDDANIGAVGVYIRVTSGVSVTHLNSWRARDLNRNVINDVIPPF